tara:strand:+ start:254 stop:379 length:126 start_codon:yes stop_codon:yes gene_type:complete
VILEFPYGFNDFNSKQELDAYLAVSALRAGIFPDDILIGYA